MKNTLGLKDHAILQCDRYKLFNLKKLLMITKISCALLFISCFQLKAETFSQTISLNARSVKLKRLLNILNRSAIMWFCTTKMIWKIPNR